MNRGLIELISGDDLVLVISAQDENGGSVSLEGNTLALRVGDKNGKLMVTGTDTDNMDGTHTLAIEAVNTKRDENISNTVAQSNETQQPQWVANDYKQGDISGEKYTVKSGDTLWEIAEAVYGDGSQWVKLLDANSSNIGYLSNGQQSLIVPGQVLNIVR